MSIILAYDAIHNNINSIPKGVQAAGYTTGSNDIKWTPGDWSKHPNAIRICQDHGSDTTADELDMENGAATPEDCAVWAPKALASFNHATRVGQRMPAIYASASRLTEVVNALIKGGLTGGIGLHVANWSLSQAQSIIDVLTASGPFPIIAVQFRNEKADDVNVYSSEWLAKVSRRTVIVSKIPPGQWNDPKQWNWKEVTMSGVGMDGLTHVFVYNPMAGNWVKMS